MNQREKRKLYKEIKQLCEKQYRKGVQQGVGFYCQGWMNEIEASDFRHKYGGAFKGYNKCVDPITKQPDMKRRLSVEFGVSNINSPLSNLLREFDK